MIITGPLSAFDMVMDKHRPGHVISLLSPDMMMEGDRRIAPERHLRLSLNDITSARDNLVAPSNEHIHELIGFIQSWAEIYEAQKEPLFIHCFAGISRSPAASYIALCLLNPEIEEISLAKALRSVNLSVTPNAMMIQLADEIMKREGRMISAINEIGRGENAWEGEVFPLPPFFPKPTLSGRHEI